MMRLLLIFFLTTISAYYKTSFQSGNSIPKKYLKQHYINIKSFGAKGDSVTDDKDAIIAASKSSNADTIFFPEGVYRIKSFLDLPMKNIFWKGIPGKAKIVGDFGYALIRFRQMINCSIEGITFQNDYINQEEDKGKSIVYTYDSVINTRIDHCTFTCPKANTSALTFYTNLNETTSNVIDSLIITNCTFLNVGRIGCTIMNRDYTSPRKAQYVMFNNNIGKNLGLCGDNGFLLSLDGRGGNFQINNNKIENALVIGIENTGWEDGEFVGNTFSDFKRPYAPFSFSGNPKNPFGNKRNKIIRNNTIGKSLTRCNFFDIADGYFSNNNFSTTGKNEYAVSLRNTKNCVFEKEQYNSEGIYAIQLLSDTNNITTNNKFIECTFSTKNSMCTYSVVRMYGPNTTKNSFVRCRILKGKGGKHFDEINNASANTFSDCLQE
jgi:hypothetical protein